MVTMINNDAWRTMMAPTLGGVDASLAAASGAVGPQRRQQRRPPIGARVRASIFGIFRFFMIFLFMGDITDCLRKMIFLCVGVPPVCQFLQISRWSRATQPFVKIGVDCLRKAIFLVVTFSSVIHTYG